MLRAQTLAGVRGTQPDVDTGHRAVLEKSYEPHPIGDHQTVETSFDVGPQFRAGRVLVDLDIDHPSRSDLTVTLTSPSGKTATISKRDMLRRADLKGTFDLTSVFDREPVQGVWKLSVTDGATGDTGTLNSWWLRIEEGEARPVPPRPGATDDTSTSAGLVALSTSRTADGRFQLLDKTRGQGIETRDGFESGSDGTFKPITDDDDVWGKPTDSPRQAAAIDAHYAAQVTYDFLRDVLGRDSIDGEGGKISLNMHAAPALRAQTNWGNGQLWFFHGPGDTSHTSLDVVGTELMRGLIEKTARLGDSGEQYAVASAMREILGGAGVEWYAMQRNAALAQTADPWVVASGQNFLPMNMADPKSDGESVDHYSELDPRKWWLADGIIANAFYLLTHGGTNSTSKQTVTDPIGMEQGLKIFGRALIRYLPPTANIAQARKATLQAATELYGDDSRELAKLKEAWGAVGVGSSSGA